MKNNNYRAITIQRLSRGYTGRKNVLKRRERLLMHRSALKIQCWMRVHFAMVRSQGVRNWRKRQSAVMTLKKCMKGVTRRKHLERQKLTNEASNRIIYFFFWCRAMKERSKMIKKKIHARTRHRIVSLQTRCLMAASFKRAGITQNPRSKEICGTFNRLQSPTSSRPSLT